MKDHAHFLAQLGGGTKVAAWLSERGEETVDREAVYKWQENGVAWRYRPLIAVMASERDVPLPEGFLPTVAA